MKWREHSLSLALGTGSAVSVFLSAWVKHGTWWYDFWMMISGSFLGSLVLILLAPLLWEKGADPAKPPVKRSK